MAKKFKQYRRIDINQFVSYLYDHGVFQSFIVNSAIIIVLGLITHHQDLKHNKPILLSFVNKTEIIEDFHQIENIPDSVTIEQAVETDDSKYIENIVSELASKTQVVQEDIVSIDLLDTNINIAELRVPEENLMVDLKPKTTPNPKNRTSNSVVQPTVNILNAEGFGNLTENMHNQDASVMELNKRLDQYGAKGGDIQISLSWNTVDDIDLHVTLLPMRSQINWTRKFGLCGGILDIDMNAHPNMLTNRPIENVFWRNNMAPKGTYVVGIHNYMPWSRNPRTEVLVVVKIKGKVHSSKKVNILYGQGIQEVTRFNYQ